MQLYEFTSYKMKSTACNLFKSILMSFYEIKKYEMKVKQKRKTQR